MFTVPFQKTPSHEHKQKKGKQAYIFPANITKKVSLSQSENQILNLFQMSNSDAVCLFSS